MDKEYSPIRYQRQCLLGVSHKNSWTVDWLKEKQNKTEWRVKEYRNVLVEAFPLLQDRRARTGISRYTPWKSDDTIPLRLPSRRTEWRDSNQKTKWEKNSTQWHSFFTPFVMFACFFYQSPFLPLISSYPFASTRFVG